MTERDFAFMCVGIVGVVIILILWALAIHSNKGIINPKYICRCDKGIYRPDGSVIWNEGGNYPLKEKFYKCDHCGRVVSDQWPEYW